MSFFRKFIFKYAICIILLFVINDSFSQGLSVTGVVEADTFSGVITTASQPNITSLSGLTSLTTTGTVTVGTLSATTIKTGSLTGLNNITLSGTIAATTLSGTLSTVAQPNITSVGQLANLSVLNVVSAGSMQTQTVTNTSGALQLRETGGEYGEAGMIIYNKTGSNGPVFYTNPTNAAIDLVDFGFLSQATNSQTNLRFEHRSTSVVDALNTNGEMQVFHITNNGAAATPATAFAGIGSFVTSIISTNAIKLTGGTGANVFSTTGAGTLVLGGSASTGDITLGESSNTQTVKIGSGAGVSTVNIATTSVTPKITIGRASTNLGAGLRLGNGRFTINKPTTPLTALNANTTLTVAQLLDVGIIGFTSTTARNLTLPSAQGATGIVQALPGTPAIGDVFSFVVFNRSNANITLVAGTGGTITGPPTMFGNGSGNSRTYYCRVTSVAANAETIVCY